jgi:hypothetical protein
VYSLFGLEDAVGAGTWNWIGVLVIFAGQKKYNFQSELSKLNWYWGEV